MAGSITADNGLNITFDDKDEFPIISGVGKDATWASTSPMTSWAPILGYSSSTPFKITVCIRFSIEEGPVMSRVKQCRSLVLPMEYRPPQVTFTLEKYIENFKGIASSVSEGFPDGVSWIDGEPAAVDVTIVLEECDEGPLTSVYGGSGG